MMKRARRVVILTSGFGEGHNTAARNLGDAIRGLDSKVRVEVRDVIAEAHPVSAKFLMRGYLWLIRRLPKAWGQMYRWSDTKAVSANGLWLAGLRRHLAEVVEGAESVVSTHPFYAHGLKEISGEWSNGVVVTDSISIHRSWVAAGVDRYFVTDEKSAERLREKGAEGEIEVSGFPVDRRMGRDGAVNWSPGERFRVLCFGSTSVEVFEDTLAGLARCGVNDLVVTILLGRSDAGHREVASSFLERYPRIAGELMEWTNQVPELMRSHHLVVSKAGGATTHECIQSGRPMLICAYVPGQEEGNVELVVKGGGGILGLGVAGVAKGVREMVGEGGWKSKRDAMMRLAKTEPALGIARRILGMRF